MEIVTQDMECGLYLFTRSNMCAVSFLLLSLRLHAYQISLIDCAALCLLHLILTAPHMMFSLLFVCRNKRKTSMITTRTVSKIR